MGARASSESGAQKTARTATTPGPENEELARIRKARFGRLPRRIGPEQQVESVPEAPPDPRLGRDSDNDWLLRYSG